MYKITWDPETGGVRLHSRIVDGTLGISPRPVFFEELNLLNIKGLGFSYPNAQEPILWAINKQYFYRGQHLFDVKGANIYDKPSVILDPEVTPSSLTPVDVATMLEHCKDYMFLLESEAIEFINDTFTQYAGARKTSEQAPVNRLDYEALAARAAKKTKTPMAIVKQDCDSFDIVPLDDAQAQGRRIFQTTHIDRFIASFSGGKDSQVVLDLCTRAIPSTDFEVIYSDTGYELPPSLVLYEEVQRYYHAKYPDLKFSTTRNHRPVLDYWDLIGTPSDSHRWCCSIMKTAPLYRSLKLPHSNKQAKVLTFDGVRAEESTKRSGYGRIGKGKHTSVTNAHPIINWNTVEIFLYLWKYGLPINPAYRQGKARVGCLICPFSTAWDDMISNKKYERELQPFTNRLLAWSEYNKIGNSKDFIKERQWKIKAIGNTELAKCSVTFLDSDDKTFTAVVKSPSNSIYQWLPALCEYTKTSNGNIDKGLLKYKGEIYKFILNRDITNNQYIFTVENTTTQLGFTLRRIVYKSVYCIQCEACEVDCPTGALSVVPSINIDKEKCIHCHICLNSHDLGCITADAVRMIKDMDNNENTKIQGYKTFGFRQQWLQEYLADPDDFWKCNSLGTAQLDGYKTWLRDAEINDSKNRLTKFGEILKRIYEEQPKLTWEMILTNLSYNSFIVKWFTSHIKIGQEYDRKTLESMINDEGFSCKGKTVYNAVGALIQTFDYSPLGSTLNMGLSFNGKMKVRSEYKEVSKAGLAYCLYKYAEDKGVRSLRVSDFYNETCTSGPYHVLGIPKHVFVDTLKALNSATNRVLIAELSMGLDSITLRDDLTPITCLEILQ